MEAFGHDGWISLQSYPSAMFSYIMWLAFKINFVMLILTTMFDLDSF